MKNLILILFSLACFATVHSQIIYITPDGAGLKDGTSWANALDGNFPSGNGFTKLADSMRLATSGIQFWIAEGTYKACTDDDREKYFSIVENVGIFGGFAGTETSTDHRDLKLHTSTFSGNIGLEDLDTDNSFHVLVTSGSSWTNFSTLDGVRVEKGYAGNSSYSSSDWRNNGGGIYNGHQLILSNNEFSICYAYQNGGAVFNNGIIEANNCLFDHNSAGSGGGFCVTYSTNSGVIQAKLSHCNFSNNTSWYSGGAITNGGVAEIDNCLIVNNSAVIGGGIYCGGTANMNFIHTDIFNTTISNNSYDALFSWGSAKIYNSIIWGTEIATWNNPTLDIRNSCIQGAFTGIGIIQTDPKFICPTRGGGTDFDGLGANWALLGNSPVIDKGDNNLIPADLVSDLAGNPRVHSLAVDLGAYERQTPLVPNEGCINSDGVNIEYFNNPQPNLQDAPTGSATQIVPINLLGSGTLLNFDNNAFRIRGYLLPPTTGYYKFYLSSFSWSTFYLSLDSMEYHKKLAITSCCNFQAPWPVSYSDRNEQNTTYHMDSIFLNQDVSYYFEINENYFPGTVGKYGIRWTLPGSNLFEVIDINNLKQAGPKYVRSDVEWELFKNKNNYNFETLRNTDSVPSQKVVLKSLITENFSTSLDHFNSRIRGYIVPTISGNYSFYFAVNDAGQFWLSSDTSKVQAQLKSNITSAQTDWKQNSSSQTLVAEKKYYFEILHHENSGDDQVKLGWALQGDTLPEIITNTYLIGYLDSIQPTRVSFEEKIIYVRKNQPITPGYQVYPWNAANKKLIWRSSDESIATVDGSGLITPLKAGLCKISIQSEAEPSLTDTLKIIVTRVELEVFKNIYTINIEELKDSPKIPDELTDIETLERSSIITLDYFSSRVRGYLLPPVSGNYTFYFAADDAGQFWLSPDSIATNAILKNDITSIQTDWMQNTSTQELIAGKKYFFELLHYENNYTDLFKLGWKIPGKDAPEVIETPYMTGWIPEIAVESFSFLEHENISFPKSSFTPKYSLKPWNTNNNIQWSSSNANVASVNTEGVVTTENPGSCQIIALMAENQSVGDTLNVTVTDYYGSYFVKENASADGTGQSWDNPISLTRLLDRLNPAEHQQRINVFVAEGTYKPTDTTDRTKTFLLNNIRMVGGFATAIAGSDTTSRDFLAHETILSGEMGVPDETIDNSYHVVVAQGNAGIDGFTIRDGRASCSTNGWTPGISYYKRDDNGGGILVEGANTLIKNCKITNNSAWNGGGGIDSRTSVKIQNCIITGNKTQGSVIGTGGMFEIIVNGNGAAIKATICNVDLFSCTIYNNISKGHGGAIFLQGATVNIDGSSFYNNGSTGTNNSLYAKDGSGINMNNTTVKGEVYGFFSPLITITNSTITGSLGASYYLKKNGISFDNSIVSDFDLSAFPDTSIVAKYSILGNQLYGADKESILSTNIPGYTTWLDSLAYNGGPTPTMKLKTLPYNPAKSNGNPLYLDSLDQRGAIRSDSVSIGAYQWVKPSIISLSPQQITLCQGDSIDFSVTVMPEMVSDSSFTRTSSNNSIAQVFGSKIYAIAPGNVNIIVQATDGGLADTCKVIVMGPVGTGTITGETTVCQGETSVTYSITGISNASSYIWALPTGASGNSLTNIITVNFDSTAVSGNISVNGQNICGDGAATILPITVKPLVASAGVISGNGNVCIGQNSVIYSVPAIANAISYIWTVPIGASGSSDTNSIVIDFGVNAVSGEITVKGINSCGDGSSSTKTITINPVYTFTENHSICSGQTYTWQGNTYNTAGAFSANYSSISGCDSVYTLNLVVNPVYAFTDNHSICSGQTYTWQGNTYNTAGAFSANYSSISGCDSIYTLNLTVNPVYAFTENHSICSGQTYNWQGNTYNTAGAFSVNFSNISGCDSIYTLNLTVNPVYAFTENHSICSGQTYTWQGNTYNTAGAFSANYSSISGCDSIYTLNLTVDPVYAFTENHSICSGETYTWQGNTYNTAGAYSANYSSISGCDSIYTLNLTVNPVYTFTENHSICSGQTYTWQGTEYTYAGTYTANYSSINSCDSIFTLNLTVNPVYSFTENHSICAGETYTWHGTDYTSAGTFTANYFSISGCDSIFTLNLAVNFVDVNVTLSGTTLTASAIADAYQWLDCNSGFAPIAGEENQSFTASSNGDYAVAVTQGTCSDTSACIQILTVNIRNSGKLLPILVYPNPFVDQLTIELKGNTQSMDFELVNALGQVIVKGNMLEIKMLETTDFAPGVYVLKIKRAETYRFVKIIKE